jgi:hypothetical protein
MGCAGSTPAEPIGKEQVSLGLANAPRQEHAGGSPQLELEDEFMPFKGEAKLSATFKDLHKGKPGCVIPKAELRAATVDQLQALAKHIERRCEAEGWADSRDPSIKLTARTVSLYAADGYVIRPATEARKCAYIELVAICAQPPKWFCSHWWGEPVLDFVDCVVTHAEDHGYSLQGCEHYEPLAGYWVCAYANNQWDLASVNAPTLEETSFYKALKLAEGAISILDKDGMCFKRMWCTYECYIVLTKMEGLKYEVYTAKEHYSKDAWGSWRPRSAVGIIEGLGMRVWYAAEEPRDKALRQGYFPMGLAKQAYQITLETAEASVEADRVKILNTIAEQADLAAEPPKTHEHYDALNAILRGRFAIVWMMMMRQQKRQAPGRLLGAAAEEPSVTPAMGTESSGIFAGATHLARQLTAMRRGATQRLFDSLDANGDGRISALDFLDRNSDGKIDLSGLNPFASRADEPAPPASPAPAAPAAGRSA